MKNLFIRNLPFILAAAVVAAVLPVPDAAWASTIRDVVVHGKSQISTLPWLISGGCYAGGILAIMNGAMKMKDHAANPSGTKMTSGVGRVVAGSALVSLPALVNFTKSSVGISTGTVGLQDFARGMVGVSP